MPEENPDDFYTLVEIDCSTGQSTKRRLTEEEIAELEKVRVDQENQRAVLAAQEQERQATKAVAASKLEALGLTQEEIKALTGN